MKKLVNVTEVSGEGLEKLLGEQVFLLCSNYFYEGQLVGVNDNDILLSKPSIVYETGPWKSAVFKDKQELHCDELYVRINMIEAYCVSK